MKNFDVDSTSLKIFPCFTHTQTFDRRPFPMYSQHELCRWKNTTSAPWACLKTHIVFLAQCDAQLVSKNKLWEWIAAIDIISYKSNLRFGTTSLRAWHRSGQTSVQTLITWWEHFKIIIILIVDYLVGAGSKLLSVAIIIIIIDYLVRPSSELTLLIIIIIVG